MYVICKKKINVPRKSQYCITSVIEKHSYIFMCISFIYILYFATKTKFQCLKIIFIIYVGAYNLQLTMVLLFPYFPTTLTVINVRNCVSIYLLSLSFLIFKIKCKYLTVFILRHSKKDHTKKLPLNFVFNLNVKKFIYYPYRHSFQLGL